MLGDAHERVLLALLLGEEGRDAALARLRHAGGQRPVDLARRARAEGLGERRRRETRLGDQQAAGRVLVEPMHEARPLAVDARLRAALPACRRHGASCRSRPAPTRPIGLFSTSTSSSSCSVIDLRKSRVFSSSGERRDALRRVELERRDAHLLADLEPILGVDALAVHPHLAFAHDALDVAERQAGKLRLEKAIDPHAGFVGADRDGLHAGRDFGKRRRRLGFGLGLAWRAWFECSLARRSRLERALARLARVVVALAPIPGLDGRIRAPARPNLRARLFIPAAERSFRLAVSERRRGLSRPSNDSARRLRYREIHAPWCPGRRTSPSACAIQTSAARPHASRWRRITVFSGAGVRARAYRSLAGLAPLAARRAAPRRWPPRFFIGIVCISMRSPFQVTARRSPFIASVIGCRVIGPPLEHRPSM